MVGLLKDWALELRKHSCNASPAQQRAKLLRWYASAPCWQQIQG
jgi:hypothetical protein